jgi:hypothetical protein
MVSKIYAVQPYEVGPKNRKKSLALVIPSKIAEEYDINTSTIFAVQLELQLVNTSRKREIIPVAVSSEADSNQVSEGVQ